jgi:hypothetical protein
VGAAQTFVPILFIAAMFAVMALIVLVRKRQRGVHAKNLHDAAVELGLRYEAKGDTAFRDAWSALPGIPNRGEVRHVCFGEYRGLPVTAFRHRYVVSTGQSSAAVVHWVFATDTPQWPALHLRRRSSFGRLLGMRSAVTGDPAFDRAWVVKAESEAFAAEVLSAGVREFLMRPEPVIARWATVRWHFVGGKVCLVVRGGVRTPSLALALDHLVEMWTALHPA